MTRRGPTPATMGITAGSVDTIVALAADACRELQRLRARLARLPELAEAAPPLTDDWRIAEDGLFGPAGILDIITAAGPAGEEFDSSSDMAWGAPSEAA